MRLLVAGALLLATTARAAAPPTTATVASLLSATAPDGGAMLSPAEKEYYESLPQRAHDLLERAVADALITSPVHLGTILALRMPAPAFELAMGDRCFICHSDREVHSGPTLLSPTPGRGDVAAHMDLAAAVSDVHFRRGLSCAGCHGGDPTDAMGHDHPASWPQSAERRQTDRAWIPAFCGRCHSDSNFMRQFNPTVPTDQLEKYRQSRHGVLLAGGDSRAAQCVSCHGVHGIRDAKNPLSTVYPTRVPATCGSCHGDATRMAAYTLPDGSPYPTNQVEQYRASIHGKALLDRGDLGAPACNDCHGNHAATPPEVASVAEICRTCHARNGALFDSSKHKDAFVARGWAECNLCHGTHAITKTNDAMLAPGPESMCAVCHAQHAIGNPACNAAVTHFYDTLTRLASGHAAMTEQAEAFERRGLDTEGLHDELAKLWDSLQQTRSYVHSFDPSAFDQVAKEGVASLATMDTLVEAAEAEHGYRRRGLFFAVLSIGIVMLLLRLKLRRMEQGTMD